ncbi:MAG: alpha/beta hydrolase [Usitatibacter sp.]
MICAHGYSGNARDFDYVAREMSRDARVICPDVAGRGESAWLPNPLEYNFPQFLADMRTLLIRLEVDEVEWIGTSMGGLLGMLLAAQPGSPIQRLVMNDIGAYVPAEALSAIARNLEAPDRFATLAEVEAHLRHTHREWGEIGDAQWKQMAIHGSRRTPTGYRLHFDPQIARIARPIPFSPGLHFWDAWYRVRCPVLLLRGEDSNIFPRSVADAMLAIRPEAELVELPGCGHAPGLMSPEHVAPLREFLLPRVPHFSQAATSSAPSLKSGFLGMFSAFRSS